MPNFNVPVVFNIKAKTQEEAERKVSNIFSATMPDLAEYEPKLHKSIKYWDFATIQGRTE